MSEWRIEDQPAAYQARYWRLRAEQAEARLTIEQKRKEPGALVEAESALKDARRTVEIARADSEKWKQIGLDAFNRVIALEAEGAAAVLKRERDQWRASWRNCTRRLADKIEHLGLDHSGTEPNADAA